MSYCYVCKTIYDTNLIYENYQDMCLKCGQFNYQQKIKIANLSSCVSLVTGIRQKIGLEIALKILRCGGKVIGTTRFPYLTLYNYSKQKDYNIWKQNLIIYQCDFTNLNSVQKLITFVKTKKINIFINNACQTIPPSDFYKTKITNLEKQIMFICTDVIEQTIVYPTDADTLLSDIVNNDNKKIMQVLSTDLMMNEYIYFNQQQLILDCNNININQLSNYHLELNKFSDIQDINIKNNSSWSKSISDIDSKEILETIIINQTVPTLIIHGIKDYMIKPRFIIQVTALEGQFNSNKTGLHAHTNMCKSAMNMLIRTLSEENEKDQFVFSINPGFVSGVNPQEDTHYPLTPVDGASRILHPIIEYYNQKKLPKNWIHLRNYKIESW